MFKSIFFTKKHLAISTAICSFLFMHSPSHATASNGLESDTDFQVAGSPSSNTLQRLPLTIHSSLQDPVFVNLSELRSFQISFTSWVQNKGQNIDQKDREQYAAMTLSEAKQYFYDFVSEQLNQELTEGDNKDEILARFFSPENFPVDQQTSDDFDFINASENQAISFLKTHSYYLFSDVSNALIYGNDPLKNKFRENPLSYFISGDIINKWLLSKTCYKDDDYRTCYGRFNQNPDRTYEQYKDWVFGPDHFGFPKDEAERHQFHLTKDFSYLTQDNISSVYKTAMRIIEQTADGDNLVIFGNTPYFVGRALKRILQDRPDLNRNIIEFPFSGSPNRVRPGNFPDFRDYVTKERHNHLKARLKEHKLLGDDLLGKTTFFIDVIASGSGPAFVLETMLKDFQDQSDAVETRDLPDIRLIALNKIDISNKHDRRNKSIATENGNDGDTISLSFPNVTETRFSVPCHVMYMKGHARFDMLPSGSLRALPEYNAAYWNEEHDFLLGRELSPLMELMMRHFDVNIEKHLEQTAPEQE